MRHEFTRDVHGGLNTNRLPWNLQANESPDLKNVLVDDNGIGTRKGFTPLIRERPKMNAVRNVGWVANSRSSNSVPAGNVDFRVVPGHMLAGHRQPYYTATAFTFDLFLEIDDLTSALLGGNGTVTGSGANWESTNGYQTWVRPILSKGPIKRTDYQPAIVAGPPAWNAAAATEWGVGGNDGMSFCLYLRYSGTAWEFKLSAHVDVAAIWTLQTATSTVLPEVGGRYHIIGVVSGARVALRIARIYGEETPSYTLNETTFTGTLATNQCPIQVFDCPQQFIQATTVGTADQRPGLGLNTASTGGYWFGSLRFEGAIEDLAIWNGDQLSGTNRDRETKLDLTQQSNLLGYWDMLGTGERVVKEQTGVGNHLYMVPWGPIFDPHSGAVGGDSWWFNGLTSYALPDLDRGDGSTTGNASWRRLDTAPTHGAFQYAVLNNLGHGLSVAFWVDSIEPNQEQVIAEIHGVLRLSIGTNGVIRGYCRTSAAAGVPAYQAPVVSNITVYPGTRYSVTLWRRSGGSFLDLYVNETLDASIAVVANDPAGNVVGGITIGMGSAIPMVNSTVALVAVNSVNTDSRTGFIGRIESVKVVGGYLEDTVLDEGLANWIMNQSRLWNLDTANPTFLFPADDFDTVRNIGNGLWVELSGHHVGNNPLRYVASDTTSLSGRYTLGAPGSLVRRNTAGTEGHSVLEMMGARIFHTLLHYRLNVDDRDVGFAGSHYRYIEYRYDGGPVAQANEQREVHIQESECTDDCGIGGAIQRRCIDSDVMSENYALGPNNMLDRSATHRQRPYLLRSPREIGTRWCEGMVRPLCGTNPISLLVDWEQQEGGRRITVTGAGRNLWQARPVWAIDSPFPEVQPRALSFGGQDGDHAYLLPTDTSMRIAGSATINTIIVDFWCKPVRLDGDRTIACYGQFGPTAATNRINWRIGLSDGSLVVQGTQAGGTKYWAFVEGTAPGGGTAARFVSSVRCGRWNHVQITMQTTGITALVNGKPITLFDLNGLAGPFQTDPWAGDTRDAPTINRLDIGGHPRGRNVSGYTSAVAGTTHRNVHKSFDGLLADFRVKATGALTFVPLQRATASGALLVLPLNEGVGWRLDSLVGWDAQVMIRELARIAEGLEESTGFRYASAAFRDRLIATNGESRPQRIRYTKPTDPEGPFRCEQLGIHAPVASGVIVTATQTAAADGTLVDGTVYQVWLTFGNEVIDTESEPTLIGTATVPAGTAAAADYMTVRIVNLPRSWDPQVTVRRLYVGVTAGLLIRTLPNNEGADFDFTMTGADTGETTPAGRLPAPRARHIALAGSFVVLADLTEFPAGQNAFAWSQPQEPSYWPVETLVNLDSEDGRPITGLRRTLGHVFIHKRDQLSQFAPAMLDDPASVPLTIRLSNASDGLGGSAVTAKNLIYGAGDRGVFVFDNVNLTYLSEAIEPTWLLRDRQDEVLALRQHGVYLRDLSHYWLSAPLQTERWATQILAMLLDGPPVWMLLEVPEHSIMSTIEALSGQRRDTALGTTSGRLLQLSDTVAIDGHDGVASIEGALALQSGGGIAIASSTSTSLSITGGAFDMLLSGLEGLTVTLTYQDGLGGTQTATRRIERGTQASIRWNTPLSPFGGLGVTAFVIGAIEHYWTSPWLSVTEKLPTREQDCERVVAEFAPTTTAVEVGLASLRQTDEPTAAFPAAYEPFMVTPTAGWLAHQLKPRAHAQGHLHRVRVRTVGIGNSWTLSAYGLESRDLRATMHGGRTV